MMFLSQLIMENAARVTRARTTTALHQPVPKEGQDAIQALIAA
jgi:hypothetical protein